NLHIKPWLYIELPALAYEDDLLGRQPGEVLWEERYPMSRLNELAAEMGGDNSYFWMALFQQRPIPRSAGLLTTEMFQYVHDLPHYTRMRWLRSWDLAASPEKGDYISGTLIGEDKLDHKVYVADVKRTRLGPADIDRLLYQTAQEDGPAIQVWIEQEPGSSGKIAVDHYCRSVLRGFAAHGERSTGDKFVRAQPLFGAIQNRNLYLVRAHWNASFINEMITFPDGVNDDQVDSTSLGYSKLMGRRYKGVTWNGAAQSVVPPPIILDQKTGKIVTPEQIFKQQARMILGPTWRT
ncbi:MAG TPA: phage terminase large subunit, partial [Ktedonobacteraceae bacterium]